MSKKNKKNVILSNIKVESYAGGGKSIGKVEDKIVFIKHSVPGDIVNIRLKKNKSKWAEGILEDLIEPSPHRQQALCKHFDYCGGCSLQMITYDKQLEYKQQEIIDKFKQIGGKELKEFIDIIPADNIFEYRNKLEFSCSDNRFLMPKELNDTSISKNQNTIGFHIAGFYNHILDIKQCLLMSDEHNKIRNFVRAYCNMHHLKLYNRKENKGFLRNVVIKKNVEGYYLLYFIFCDNDEVQMEHFLKEVDKTFERVVSIFYSHNKKLNDSLFDLKLHHFCGEQHILEHIGNYAFYLTPKSFFQTNTYQAEKLYAQINSICQCSRDDIVYDLFCGSATISIYISQYVKKVVGIEVLGEAIEDANDNVAINNISNVEILKIDLDTKKGIDALKTLPRPDIIILDPPRAGLSSHLIAFLLELLPEKILYVSCNPSTQARDYSLLKYKYSIKTSQAVDMFPQTYHIENILLLTPN